MKQLDPQLTEQLKNWLDSEDKDMQQGAHLLLRLSGNKIMYQNIIRRPEAFRFVVEKRLKQYYEFRLLQLTKEQVQQMDEQAEKIVESRHLDKPKSEFKNGRRLDHDSLPVEIKALYEVNIDILHRMRALHEKLKLLSEGEFSCPESERFPFLKELIALDKEYRQNWLNYDSYCSEEALTSDEKAAIAYRLINLNKGQYAKTRDPKLKDKLAKWYAQIPSPSPATEQDLKELGVI